MASIDQAVRHAGTQALTLSAGVSVKWGYCRMPID